MRKKGSQRKSTFSASNKWTSIFHLESCARSCHKEKLFFSGLHTILGQSGPEEPAFRFFLSSLIQTLCGSIPPPALSCVPFLHHFKHTERVMCISVRPSLVQTLLPLKLFFYTLNELNFTVSILGSILWFGSTI